MSNPYPDMLVPKNTPLAQKRPNDWWYSEVLDYTHDAIIVWGLGEQGIVYWNGAAEQLYGYTAEEAMGRVTHTLLQTQLSVEIWQLEAAIQRYGVWTGELRHTTRDGRTVTVDARLILLRRDDRWLVAEINRRVL